MQNNRKAGGSAAFSILTETFGLSEGAATSVLVFATILIIAGIYFFIRSAPPRQITITSGPPGSAFYRAAESYSNILASNGVTLKILESQGSVENMRRLANPGSGVDIGFIQAGEGFDGGSAKLFSLGSISYQPLLIFYRSDRPVQLLSGFSGKRLAIGPVGSGTRTLAQALLATNGITEKGDTVFVDLKSEDAPQALIDGKVDAVFLMGDSASSQAMRSLSRAPGVQLFDFVQADGYTRRFTYLNKLILPRGGFDFGKDMPARDIVLIGPAVDLVARAKLHPALSDLLIEAAQHTHGKPNLLQRRDEFPAPIEHEFPISPDATRYYKSGKSLFYRYMPFWLASLLSRVLVVFVPIAIVLIPGLRLIPAAFRFKTQIRIYRWYRSLLKVERDLTEGMTDQKRADLCRRLDDIELAVNQMKIPASFAGQFYGLREHIGFVRGQIVQKGPGAPA
jgi:hypothetical protein